MTSIKQYLKEEKDGLIKSLIASILVTILFCSYVYFIGFPMTKAKQLYNEGMILLGNGKEEQAKQKFMLSNSTFKTKEVTTQLESLD